MVRGDKIEPGDSRHTRTHPPGVDYIGKHNERAPLISQTRSITGISNKVSLSTVLIDNTIRFLRGVKNSLYWLTCNTFWKESLVPGYLCDEDVWDVRSYYALLTQETRYYLRNMVCEMLNYSARLLSKSWTRYLWSSNSERDT